MKFNGNLEWIDSHKLITENKSDKLENFFIGLGVIFNDLKGLIFFETLMMDNFDVPNVDEITDHSGNYSGIIIQLQKLIASVVREFFIFLEKNSDVFSMDEFGEIKNKLNNDAKNLWDELILYTNGSKVESDTMKTIIKIRNNLAYHFDHSGKVLRNGYESFFFRESKSKQTEKAYYSIGGSVSDTRFYFSDAAVQESIFIAAGKKPKEDNLNPKEFTEFQETISKTVRNMSAAIAVLIRNYIQWQRNRTR